MRCAMSSAERAAGAPGSPRGAAATLDELAVEPGLCAGCVHRRLLRSSRSVFLRCALAEADPRFSRYPALPVRACDGFRPPPEATP